MTEEAISQSEQTPTTSIPQQSREVDGGGSKDLEAQLASAQKAYQGMQRNYNSLFESKRETDNELTNLSEQFAAAQAEVARLTEEMGKLQEGYQQTQSQYSATQAELDMHRLVAGNDDFAVLRGIVGTLTPKDSVEATEEMLKNLAQGINAQVQSGLRAQQAIPGGNFGRQDPPSLDQLRKEAIRTAGTPAYREASAAYYQAVQADGSVEIPKPLPLPFTQ